MSNWLIGKNISELRDLCNDEGFPKFVATQIVDWLYKKRVRTIDEMTNLSKSVRACLSSKYTVGGFEPLSVMASSDGTKKYLFPTIGGDSIEAVMIPDGERVTLCVSSQSGCRMGCKFCMTARMGFRTHLSSGEILSQILNVQESNSITNVVFMGMGEPLDNIDEVLRSINILTDESCFAWSPKRITVSTIGVIPALRHFLDLSRCHLAISLHNPFPENRRELMPIQNVHNIEDVVELVRGYDFTGQRRVSFEYIMFSGWNDDKRHADALLRMIKGLECRVNLIRFHEIPDFPYTSSPMPVIENFRQRLNSGGVIATIRASRGEDILAACGMLSSSHIADV